MRFLLWEISAVKVQGNGSPPAQGQREYVDALSLLVRHYRGQPWSRREMVRRGLPERRWRAAHDLLHAAGVLDALDAEPVASIWKLWWHHAQEEQKLSNGNFVPAHPPAKGGRR